MIEVCSMSTEKLTEKLQKKEMEMLVQLSGILEQNNIPFWLACGTTLGCVRHQGFIPWDDDVDIYVMGKDYPRLKEVFATQDTGNLCLQDYLTVDGYPYSFPKVVALDTVLVEKDLTHLQYRGGVYIDIFLLQETSANSLVRFCSEKVRYIRYCLLRSYYFDFSSSLRKVMHWLVKAFVNPESVQTRLYRRYVKGLKKPGFLVDTGTFGRQALLDSGYFAETDKLPYEGALMPVPGDYHGYLAHYYGDYMRLPDEDKRVSNHDFETLIFRDEEGKEQ